jgi:aspartate dehydrogenase
MAAQIFCPHAVKSSSKQRTALSMRRVGLIGCGAIGSTIVQMWQERLGSREHLAAVLVKPAQVHATTTRVGRETLVTSDLGKFHACGVDVVIEAAGHDAVAEYAPSLLERGCYVHMLSVGALAADELRYRLEAAAKRGGGRIVLPTGALAGFDGLLSMRAAGLIAVKYTSVKPLSAWRGTSAEEVCRLEDLITPRVVFAGSAKAAAIAFPRNANLASAVALAGIGFERTRVVLVADPEATEISGRIEATSAAGHLDLTLTGASFGANPKTSRITAMSAIASLHDPHDVIGFC